MRSIATAGHMLLALAQAAALLVMDLSCSAKESGAGEGALDAPAAPSVRPRRVASTEEPDATRPTGAAGPRTEPDVPAADASGGPARPFAVDPSRDPVMKRLVRATGGAFAAFDEGPYRLVVEGTEARAREVAARTVRPVVERLSKQFFKERPRPGTRLVLFAADSTYRTGAKAMTGERPDTPFGFYSHETSAVIMNLGTGGGTLVHEMVHTFTETDFPEMPSWFDEGLASLYEQCRFGEGRLVGLTNWRLPDLQEELREGKTGLIARVVETSTGAFYGPGSGLHYAVARYLCFDLQQRGLLERFYKEFRRASAKDPTGRKTLERLLGRTLDEYEPGWVERTLALRFPERPRRR